MATVFLNDEPIYPGDPVYDISRGPGKVIAIDCGRIQVSFGSRGRPRQYTPGGITGKQCYKTLYHRPPAVIEFPKDECRAAKLSCALQEIVKIMGSITSDKCCVTTAPCDTACEPTEPCN